MSGVVIQILTNIQFKNGISDSIYLAVDTIDAPGTIQVENFRFIVYYNEKRILFELKCNFINANFENKSNYSIYIYLPFIVNTVVKDDNVNVTTLRDKIDRKATLLICTVPILKRPSSGKTSTFS